MLIILLKALLVPVEIITCILLIAIILLQKTKSQGAGGLAFGAGMGETIFGPQVGNVLTKTTIVLGIVFLVNTVALSVLYSQKVVKSVVDSAMPVPAASQAPNLPESPMAQPSTQPTAVEPITTTEIPSAPITTAPAQTEPVAVPATEPAAAPAPAN